jgi:hypothetical protein
MYQLARYYCSCYLVLSEVVLLVTRYVLFSHSGIIVSSMTPSVLHVVLMHCHKFGQNCLFISLSLMFFAE